MTRATSTKQCATIADLAARIEDDIRRRGLLPGNPYQSTLETARMLQVGTTPANQAMQLLVKRNVLERKQRLGTFVGKGLANNQEGANLNKVHVLLYDHHLIDEGIFASGFLMGLQSALPGTQIQFDFVPPSPLEESPYLTEMIDGALRNQSADGFVLFNSTVEVQVAFRDSGLPVVVAGGLYASIQDLPFVDRDQRQIGRLVSEYLLDRGHRRIVMVTRQRPGLGPGEYMAADAVGEVAAAAGLYANTLMIRCLPHNPTIVRDELIRIIESSDELPGIFLRPWQMIGPIYEAIQAVGLKPQQDVAVVVADYYRSMSAPAPQYPVIRPEWTLEENGAQMGKLLLARLRNEEIDSQGTRIPVRLEIPPSLRK